MKPSLTATAHWQQQQQQQQHSADVQLPSVVAGRATGSTSPAQYHNRLGEVGREGEQLRIWVQGRQHRSVRCVWGGDGGESSDGACILLPTHYYLHYSRLLTGKSGGETFTDKSRALEVGHGIDRLASG